MSSKNDSGDKQLKKLRELMQHPYNKQCFDCGQKGPTYVNMTIGSFICMSCSGILRGINPPHRVKSISMSRFTDEEVEFLSTHGNEICRLIWLSKYKKGDYKEEALNNPHLRRTYFQKKYENKLWKASELEIDKILNNPVRSTSVPQPQEATVVRAQNRSLPPSYDEANTKKDNEVLIDIFSAPSVSSNASQSQVPSFTIFTNTNETTHHQPTTSSVPIQPQSNPQPVIRNEDKYSVFNEVRTFSSTQPNPQISGTASFQQNKPIFGSSSSNPKSDKKNFNFENFSSTQSSFIQSNNPPMGTNYIGNSPQNISGLQPQSFHQQTGAFGSTFPQYQQSSYSQQKPSQQTQGINFFYNDPSQPSVPVSNQFGQQGFSGFQAPLVGKTSPDNDPFGEFMNASSFAKPDITKPSANPFL